ncbi:MAG: hypothetical protein AAF290_07845 [Pseudomonadota bacterium]
MTTVTTPSRWWMPVAGLILLIAAFVGLLALVKLLAMLIDADIADRMWLNYALIGLALASLGFAGVSLIVSWFTRRRRDVVPGPALYLFGIAMVMLGGQAAVLGQTLVGVIGVLVGCSVIWIEYRSDWL